MRTAIVLFLMTLLPTVGVGPSSAQPMPQGNPFTESPGVTEMRSFVTRINLVNGLGLTVSQLAKFRRILVEADDIRQIAIESQKRFDAICMPEFERLKAVVWEGLPLSVDMYERCKALDDGNRILSNQYLISLQPLEKRLLEMLTPAQASLVARHADCMVPSPYLQDPERVGQAGNSFIYVALLKEVRKLSEAEFKQRESEFAGKLIKGVEGDFGLVGTVEGPALVKRCGEVVREARTLPDVSFAIKVGKLAEEMDPQVQDIRLKNLRVQNDLAIVGGLGKLGRCLLDVRLLPVVDQRIRKARSQVADNRTGHLLEASGPVAESCRGGRCAIGTLK